MRSHKYQERAHIEYGPLSVLDKWRGPLQVILKPDPGNPQELYLGSLEALGIDTRAHDVRPVQTKFCVQDSLTVSGRSVFLQSLTGLRVASKVGIDHLCLCARLLLQTLS